MTTGKLFVNNAAGILKELLSFQHRIKSVWKQAYGTEDTSVLELRLQWYLIPNLLPCKLKKNFLKESSCAQKMSPAPDTNLRHLQLWAESKAQNRARTSPALPRLWKLPLPHLHYLLITQHHSHHKNGGCGLFTGAASPDNSLLQILKPWMKNSTGNQAGRKVLEGWTALFFVASSFRKLWTC